MISDFLVQNVKCLKFHSGYVTGSQRKLSIRLFLNVCSQKTNVNLKFNMHVTASVSQ